MNKKVYINTRELISTDVIEKPGNFEHVPSLEGVDIPMITAKVKKIIQFTTDYDEMYCNNCKSWESPDNWHVLGFPAREFICTHCGHSYYVNNKG